MGYLDGLGERPTIRVLSSPMVKADWDDNLWKKIVSFQVGKSLNSICFRKTRHKKTIYNDKSTSVSNLGDQLKT